MSLYLCVYEDDEDLEGFQVGPYTDFGAFRDYVTRELEAGSAGSRFPTLILHSDCDGEWSVAECERLRDELARIAIEMKARPAVEFSSEWQRIEAQSAGLVPRNALESFLDVNGGFLVESLQRLTEFALEHRAPISFQ
ncbi:immunity 70 family protein [Myxococcus sp. K15C18031901]|uniref:Imm70 family immunity protein n=1 Tax=Myxococcus dinghuensis TaxID=2906761 RepID=UPI0020A6E513|nr:Imm70 family immunity protein [Myxococcus dinghuensis]MCP3097786.1 immunity 70 family protein [Myxococcus dinghuensis]